MPVQVPVDELHDENARIVKGWGTVDVFDKAGERLPMKEFKRIMPIIMKRGGLIMNRHTNQPVAKILNYEFKDKITKEGTKEGVYLTTEAFNDFKSDADVWKGIKDDEIQGFSFGGRNNKEELDFSQGLTRKVLKDLEGFEFSYVPKGCNQEATIEEINYIAKEDTEEGETSNDSGHYHLYKIDSSGDGKTLGTLPREAEDHIHEIKSGVVQVENSHDHRLIRMLVNKEEVQKPFAGFKDFDTCVTANQDKDNPAAFCGFLKDRVEKIEKEYEEEKSKKTETMTFTANTDDKTLSKSDSTLNSDAKVERSFINKEIHNSSMSEKDLKKVEEVPQANSEPAQPEDSAVAMNSKLDQIISLLSGVQKGEEEDKDEKDKDDEKDVEKEGDGEKVKLPESEGDEVSQEKPAEGAKGDESAANFLQKERDEIKAEVKKEIMKELTNKKADTPRPGAKANDIQKGEVQKTATNWGEANKMAKDAGLR